MSATPLTPADVQARIARLFVYPIKSCAGVELSEALLTETGLDLDRAWMVVDSEGEFLSQREAPRMALIQPAFKRGGTELQLRAPGMLALHLRVDAVEAPARVRVWDDEVPAWDMGDIAAQWFTDFLALNEQGLPKANAPKHRLVRFDPEHRRLSDRKWTGEAEALNQFSDGYPVLVLGQSALEGLNERLQARGHGPVDIRRFRPNVVLEGLEAHDEDRVGPLQIATTEGEAVLTPVKPCPRCPIPNIDPDTAHSSPEV
ncbi:MAG: MOSC N-terminal beta barrel domain-containing protein, partial [Burkholderiaceae bacterium]|nr:MOSC N-terminal beta barrel domain-containing protein [Burkholderiaceae bacterium]